MKSMNNLKTTLSRLADQIENKPTLTTKERRTLERLSLWLDNQDKKETERQRKIQEVVAQIPDEASFVEEEKARVKTLGIAVMVAIALGAMAWFIYTLLVSFEVL